MSKIAARWLDFYKKAKLRAEIAARQKECDALRRELIRKVNWRLDQLADIRCDIDGQVDELTQVLKENEAYRESELRQLARLERKYR